MQPYEGNAVLELNPSLIFPIIEILLGGNGKPGTAANREITEIEQNVLDGLFHIILQALSESWKDVVPVTLTIESVGKEARLIHAPHEPMVTMSFDIKLEEGGGQMNLAVPTEILTMQGEDDAQSAPRKVEASEAEQARIVDLLRDAKFTLEANLAGPMLRVRDLLELKEGNVLTFDHPIEQPLNWRRLSGRHHNRPRPARLGCPLGPSAPRLPVCGAPARSNSSAGRSWLSTSYRPDPASFSKNKVFYGLMLR
jgi:flagellar motor switch protein FliM